MNIMHKVLCKDLVNIVLDYMDYENETLMYKQFLHGSLWRIKSNFIDEKRGRHSRVIRGCYDSGPNKLYNFVSYVKYITSGGGVCGICCISDYSNIRDYDPRRPCYHQWCSDEYIKYRKMDKLCFDYLKTCEDTQRFSNKYAFRIKEY